MACRINRQRAWAARILLESISQPVASFVTLTYKDDSLPVEESVPVLEPRHTRVFLNRLRRLSGAKLRYFLVGEYGDRTWRPHYHAAIFGLDPGWDLVGQAWPHGFVKVDPLNPSRAMYLAHYCTKKLTKADAPGLRGRPVPEFTRMSRRPGLGIPGLEFLVSLHLTRGGAEHLAAHGDVVREFRYEKKRWPLDYFMTQALRRALDVPERACERPARPYVPTEGFMSTVVGVDDSGREVSERRRVEEVLASAREGRATRRARKRGSM